MSKVDLTGHDGGVQRDRDIGQGQGRGWWCDIGATEGGGRWCVAKSLRVYQRVGRIVPEDASEPVLRYALEPYP
jgi:hypothetical protein